jgi:hypothetical protein
MTNSRDRRKLRITRVGKYGATIQQARDAAMIIGTKTQQIVIAELVNHNDQKQFGLFGRGLCLLLGWAACRRQEQAQKYKQREAAR